MAVLAVHRQEPNWPATADRPRFAIDHNGRRYWAETDGPQADLREVLMVLGEIQVAAPEPEVKPEPVQDDTSAVIAALVAAQQKADAEISRLKSMLASLAEEAVKE